MVGAWVGSVLLAVLLGWWAGGRATLPPQVAAPELSEVTAEVVSGSVAVEQPYGVQLEWPAEPVGVNGLSGTLTSLEVGPGVTRVNAGDVVYTVDLTPVVALPGSVPAFRDLTVGARGPDVRQLEEFLVGAGYSSGAPDDRFDAATSRAVTTWSRTRGIPTNGSVPLGQVIFVPRLPASLAPDPQIRVGARVSPGESLLVGAMSEPSFTIRVLPEMLPRIAEGMQVRIQANGQEWAAEVERLQETADEPPVTVALLRPPQGAASICGDDCSGAARLGQSSTLPGTLVLVPTTHGSQVPTAAVRTDASGVTCVVLEDGNPARVTVRASALGRSIVDGVEPGSRIVVSGTMAGRAGC